MLIIDDKNWKSYVDEANANDKYGRGLVPRDFDKQPFGSMQFASAFDLPLIPREEWKERIAEMEAKKQRLSDQVDYFKIKVKNQQATNFCWINAPVHCLEIVRAVQGQDYVELSPASCGAIIKQFRNVGGWGTEGLKFLVDKGAVPTSLWPANAIDPRYNTQAANSERHKYRVLEWYELRPRNFDEFMTALFYKIPVAIGLNWWRHEVTALDPVYVNGQFGCRINNSWGTKWGDKGRGILLGNKANPDDAVAPRAVMAS